jgi:hypothetical protein
VTLSRGRIVAGVSAAVAVVLGFDAWFAVDDRPTPGVVEAVEVVARHGDVGSVSVAPAEDLFARPRLALPDDDPFAQLRPPAPAVAPAPVVPVVVSTPKPAAPPMPFKFLGRLSGDEHSSVFLTDGALVYRVAEGDVVKEAYRVESIGQTELIVTYLPLEERQIIPLR